MPYFAFKCKQTVRLRDKVVQFRGRKISERRNHRREAVNITSYAAMRSRGIRQLGIETIGAFPHPESGENPIKDSEIFRSSPLDKLRFASG